MSDPKLDPLPDDMMQLFAAERHRPDPPSPSFDRVLRSVNATIGMAPAAIPASTMRPRPALGGVPGVGLFGKLPTAISAFVIGGLFGAAVHAWLGTPDAASASAPATIVVTAPAKVAMAESAPAPTMASSAADSAPPPAHTTTTPSVPAPPSAAPTSSSHDVPGRDLDLAAERALLEVGRTALSRGRSDSALAALNLHAQRFPHGRLAEERDALLIQALNASGQVGDANARADQFHKKYPDSLFQPAVDSTLAPNP